MTNIAVTENTGRNYTAGAGAVTTTEIEMKVAVENSDNSRKVWGKL